MDFVTKVTSITLSYGQYLYFLSITFNNERTVSAGIKRGRKNIKDIILGDDEFVKKINLMQGLIVDSITFQTNIRVLGPFGGKGGDYRLTYGGRSLVDMDIAQCYFHRGICVARVVPQWGDSWIT